MKNRILGRRRDVRHRQSVEMDGGEDGDEEKGDEEDRDEKNGDEEEKEEGD